MEEKFYGENVYYKLNGEVIKRWVDVIIFEKNKYYFDNYTIVIAKTLKQAVDKYLTYELDTPINADILDLLASEYTPDTLE